MRAIFLWVILPLALAEAVLVGPWLSERLLRWGARGLPEQYQERYAGDWLGELDAVPGSLTKLAFALRVLVRVPATQRALTGREALWVLAAKRLLAMLVTGLLFILQYLLQVGDRFSQSGRADALLRRRAERSRNSTRQQKVRERFISEVEAAAAGVAVTSIPTLGPYTLLSETSMNPRTVRILSRAKIDRYGQLLDYYEREGKQGMFSIRNFGRRDLDEVIELFRSDHGGYFGGLV